MGLDDLIVAGSHGFDIWSPDGGAIQRHEGRAFARSARAGDRAAAASGPARSPGALVEPKRSSVAVHYRLVEEPERPRVKAIVDEMLGRHPDALKVTPGKMVYEIQPNIDWDKGKAVLYLLEALGLDGDDVLPLYIGDDITDEDAFAAMRGPGRRHPRGGPDDPELAGDRTPPPTSCCDTRARCSSFWTALGRSAVARAGTTPSRCSPTTVSTRPRRGCGRR